MQGVGVPKHLEGQTVGERLKKVPITRGWGGDEEAEDWMVVGTGSKLEAVERLGEEISTDGKDIEEQWKYWEEQLSHEFVEYARKTMFIRYLCPQCQSHI